MIAVAAAAVAGGAFAQNIFDYKASVKYVDFKKVSAKDDDGVKAKIWVKVVKSAKLTGYLVTPLDCPCEVPPEKVDGPCERFGNAPSFLVIENKAANKFNRKYGLSDVKIMPANLLTEWWATKGIGHRDLKATGIPEYIQGVNMKDVELQAQGYLFAGVGKRDVPDPVASPFYGLGDYGLNPAGDDYQLRTAATQFLFGEMNVVDKDDDNTVFIEPFLDQAGFGKAKYYFGKDVIPGKEGHPCYADIGGAEKYKHKICLTSLSGHLIGGSFACLVNGTYVDKGRVGTAWGYAEDWICQGWDNYTENFTSVNAKNVFQQAFIEVPDYMYNVVCGTWSIKVNPKIVACEVVEAIEACGTRIDPSFDLDTFDTPVEDDLKGLEKNFVEKWIK